MELLTKVGIEMFGDEMTLCPSKFSLIRGLPLIGGCCFGERFIVVTPDLQGKSTPDGSKPLIGN